MNYSLKSNIVVTKIERAINSSTQTSTERLNYNLDFMITNEKCITIKLQPNHYIYSAHKLAFYLYFFNKRICRKNIYIMLIN